MSMLNVAKVVVAFHEECVTMEHYHYNRVWKEVVAKHAAANDVTDPAEITLLHNVLCRREIWTAAHEWATMIIQHS